MSQKYPGAQTTIHFDSKKCIHSRHCVLTLPDVFRANVKGPWIFPDAADGEAIAALAQRCPSGAITYQRHDTNKQEQAPQVNTVRVLENGPLAVHADIHIDNQPPMFRATLCRCGASQNKPFCDGSHAAAGFAATGEPLTQASEPLEQRDGPLKITPASNGPLIVNGNVEIVGGTGRTLMRTTQAALCRCGASGNKPYCDGSHARINFTAE
jgi:CDGSH-type Zn-finger protein/uncharacterized Fe-S cluster protein YjdI